MDGRLSTADLDDDDVTINPNNKFHLSSKNIHHATITAMHCNFQQKLKLTDVEIPPTDDTGAAHPALHGWELGMLDIRRSLRRFFPSIISCILVTASEAKPHSQQMQTSSMNTAKQTTDTNDSNWHSIKF